MRIAILSDIHGNGTAFRAVVADVKQVSPDLILHGGDLSHGGSSPVEVLDQIRELGWQGVLGNTDEMLYRPESLEAVAAQSTAPATLWNAIREMADFTCDRLGEERLSWLRALPMIEHRPLLALMHATPLSPWRAPSDEASDSELESAYRALGAPVVVYGHIHRPYVRRIPTPELRELVVANSGSVGLPYDRDWRATYLLVDSGIPLIRRVEYDRQAELEALSACGLPHADWVQRMLRSAAPAMP